MKTIQFDETKYKLVPLEPTGEMIKCGEMWDDGFAGAWHRAVHAAPAAEEAPGQDLTEIEQYRMQMAGICTAALGYWKEGDGIHPDYDTPALREVARLYAKYAELYAKQQPAKHEEAPGQDVMDTDTLLNKAKECGATTLHKHGLGVIQFYTHELHKFADLLMYPQGNKPEPCWKCHGLGYYDEGHENDDGTMSGGNYVDCEKCKKSSPNPVDFKGVSKATGAVHYWSSIPSYVVGNSWEIYPLYTSPQPTPEHIKAMKQALEALEQIRVFVTTREKIKHPEGTEWYDEHITALQNALKGTT